MPFKWRQRGGVLSCNKTLKYATTDFGPWEFIEVQQSRGMHTNRYFTIFSVVRILHQVFSYFEKNECSNFRWSLLCCDMCLTYLELSQWLLGQSVHLTWFAREMIQRYEQHCFTCCNRREAQPCKRTGVGGSEPESYSINVYLILLHVFPIAAFLALELLCFIPGLFEVAVSVFFISLNCFEPRPVEGNHSGS